MWKHDICTSFLFNDLRTLSLVGTFRNTLEIYCDKNEDSLNEWMITFWTLNIWLCFQILQLCIQVWEFSPTSVDFYLVANLKKENILKHNCFLELLTLLGPSGHSDSTERTTVIRNEIITLFLKSGFMDDTSVPGNSFLEFSPLTSSINIIGNEFSLRHSVPLLFFLRFLFLCLH